MYEECPEAHEHWKAQKEAETKIVFGDLRRDGPPDYYIGLAEAERCAAADSWEAHKQGKCSCVLRALMERARQ